MISLTKMRELKPWQPWNKKVKMPQLLIKQATLLDKLMVVKVEPSQRLSCRTTIINNTLETYILEEKNKKFQCFLIPDLQ